MIIGLIKKNIYIFLLLLTITEWPITSFVGAWFASTWILNIWYVALIALLWDLIWDIILYWIWIVFHKFKFIKKFKIFWQEKKHLVKILNKSPFLFFLTVKTTPYLSSPSLIFTWIKRFKFSKFILYSFLTSIIVKVIYLSIGYFWATSVSQLTKFLNSRKQIIIYLICWIIIFFLIRKFYSYLPNLIKKESKKS